MQRALLLAGALVAFGAGFALAQVQLSRFTLADGNGDGRISRNEWLTRLRADFRAVDANGDGLLTAAERRAEPSDTSIDGVLSLAEMEARTLTRFDRIDTDGDGLVTVAELETVRPGPAAAGGH